MTAVHFSQDGKQIVFRASTPKTEQELADYNDLVKEGLVRPSTLEIFIMNSDGSDRRQITNFGKASFAPFLFPDGKRIIFSSNLNSETGRDFDLYMINVDGSALEQITHFDSFDGFPMFTRDGKNLCLLQTALIINLMKQIFLSPIGLNNYLL